MSKFSNYFHPYYWSVDGFTNLIEGFNQYNGKEFIKKKDLKFNNSTLYILALQIISHKKRIYTYLLNILLFIMFIYAIWLLYKCV